MSPWLRPALVAIVLTNLAFVHATEDASLVWLAPLYGVALASPVLAWFAERRWYRWTWNLLVVATAAWLVRSTLATGAQHLLENGLLLAAVCQVHVLSNLGRRQTPDLLFFNSFIMAVVTSFLTQDAPYSAVFSVYAACLVLGLSLYASPAAEGAAARIVLRQAAVRTGVVLAVTFTAFAVLPRDFRRKGLVVESIAQGPDALQVGFTENVRIDRTAPVSTSGAVVFRARSLDGPATDPPIYWRGATKLAFDGTKWRSGASGSLPGERWVARGPRIFERTAPAVSHWKIDLVDPAAGIAFLPLDARGAQFDGDEPPYVTPLADLTVRFPANEDGRAVGPFSYGVTLAAPRAPGGLVSAADKRTEPAVSVLPGARVPAAERITADVLRQTGPDAPQHEIVERLREQLASRTDYALPGAEGNAATLAAFIEGRGGGHCEQFATALILMLRSQRIPARLVTGFASDEWDPAAGVLTVRQRHAHAWVEVLDPSAGWTVVDPTPAGSRAESSAAAWHQRALDWLSAQWTRIVGFDDGARASVLAWIVSLPSRAADVVTSHPVGAGAGLAALIAAFALLRARRRRRVPPAVRDYSAALRRARLPRRIGETPRELLHRARSEGVPQATLAPLAAATEAHERSRFA